jgi:hypothetical protein
MTTTAVERENNFEDDIILRLDEATIEDTSMVTLDHTTEDSTTDKAESEAVISATFSLKIFDVFRMRIF